MNAPIILAHLQDPNKKYRQKTTNIRKEVEKAREKVANLLVPDHYKDVSEFREILESLLQTTSPSSHITELSLRNGQLYKKDRSKYTIDDEDQATLDNNTGSFVSGVNNLYIRHKEDIIVLENVHKSLQAGLIRVIKPLEKAIGGTMAAIRGLNEDPLTGLYNRYFIERYAKEADHKKDTTYAVIAIDLVDLKGLNKNGLAIGDLGLQKVAKILKKVFPRNSDLVARPGGDEFTIILEFPASLTKNMQELLVEERMQTVMNLLESGDDPTGIHHLGEMNSVLAIRWGAGYRDDGKSFSERHTRADERSNIGKSDNGMISRAEEAVSQTNLQNAMRMATVALARVRELNGNISLEESQK